jgi:hypothetical protein
MQTGSGMQNGLLVKALLFRRVWTGAVQRRSLVAPVGKLFVQHEGTVGIGTAPRRVVIWLNTLRPRAGKQVSREQETKVDLGVVLGAELGAPPR